MEIFLIIVLAAVCLWLGWRLFTLRKGIKTLTSALQTEPLPDRKILHPSINAKPLRKLTTHAFDTVSEAELSHTLEIGRRKILDYVLNQIGDSIFIVDEKLEIRYSNEASNKIFPGELEHIGAQLIEICRDHRIVETVTLALNTDGKMQDEVELTHSGGTLLVAAEPLSPSFQIGAGAWILIRDITAELKTEQIRKDFVANASHELRTPLSIVAGHLEILGDELDDPMAKKTIPTMRKHVDRISRIVEDMLTISKLERSDAGENMLKKNTFDLGECIFGIFEQLKPLVDKHKTKVDVQLPEREGRNYYGDRFYFDQIFFNLIENALKQNQRSGLKISVHVTRESSNGRFQIEVIDNGMGIPSADLKDVFKRFYRVEKHHTQSETKGTGLGLSIVKRAVEAHNGTVEVESQPGRKTTFRISLPAPVVDSALQSSSN